MFDGYVRVSRVGEREGETFISPDEEREKIEAFAAATGLKVRMNEPELDVTGSKLARPILDGIMERIESGRSEGVIVARVNRLSRAGLGDAIKLVERIDAAGARVGFAELGNIDPKTPQGEMVVNLWLMIARMQWREYQEKFATAKGRAIERGWHVGPTPLGFEKREKHPKTGKLIGPLHRNGDAPKVAELFEVSAGSGIHAALAYAERTWPDRSWSTFKVRRLLANRIYKGEVVNGTMVGHIEPLVDETTWDFAQHPVRESDRRKAKDCYPLSGIASCAACGKSLVGHTTGKEGNRHRAYRCTTQGCPLHVKAEPLEVLVLDSIRAMPKRGLSGDEILRFTGAIVAARGELDAYVENASVSDPERFNRGVAKREAKLTEAQRAWDEAREQHGEMPDLEEPGAEEQRSIFERAVGGLTVSRGRQPLPERVALTLAG